MMVDRDRVRLFLYLLLRDALPAGAVFKLVMKARQSEGGEYALGDPHLAALAQEHADALLPVAADPE